MKLLLNKTKSMLGLIMALTFFAAISLSSCSGGKSGAEESETTTEHPTESEAAPSAGEEHPSAEEEKTQGEEEHPSEGEEHPSDSASSN